MFSFPKQYTLYPLTVVSIMLTVVWLSSDFILIAYCFNIFVRFQQKIAIYILSRSRSTWETMKYILLRIAGIMFAFRLTRFTILWIIMGTGKINYNLVLVQLLISILYGYVIFMALVTIYLLKHDERLLIVYYITHLVSLFSLVQAKSNLTNFLYLNFLFLDSIRISSYCLVILLFLILLFIKIARKVEY